MRVFVTGATGLLGRRLCGELIRDGHQVSALSRGGATADSQPGLKQIQGDPSLPGPWTSEVAGCDALVHLAGEPIAARRWTAAQKKQLVRSRIESTHQIVSAMRSARLRPRVFVCASATGFYGPCGDLELDERSPPGRDFLAQLCVNWELAARSAESSGSRVVSLRFGVVLSREGGALARLIAAFRFGLGGPLGPRGRWFPWIHEDDATGLIRFALTHPLKGAVNAVAPGTVRMAEFAQTLGRSLRRPAWFPLPIPLLRLALGDFANNLSPGQRVAPQAALAAGYHFLHPELEGALRACLGQNGVVDAATDEDPDSREAPPDAAP